MSLRALATAALLLACAGAGLWSGRAAPAPEAGAGYVAVYRNGDLELNIRGTAGIGVVGSSLANLFRDDRREGADQRRICAREAARATSRTPPGPQPLSLGMLGAGFALLGWTRRRGSWFDRMKQGVFPWPALCWLD